MSDKKTERPAPAAGISPTDLIAYIHGVAEQHRAFFARELHDELGGLLVGASMDFAWAEQHMTDSPADAKAKLARARQSLSGAIDLKRRLIEELRPTLLDNVGLFAALRWYVESQRKLGQMTCAVSVPAEERRFLPNVSIGLFRIVQESLQLLMPKGHMASGKFEFLVDIPNITIRVLVAPLPGPDAPAKPEANFLASIEQRAAALGGTLAYARTSSNNQHITARFAADRILAPAA